MTPQQLELIVLGAVDALRAGGQIEDDRIEVKREWPTADKARQLCGTVNRARGNAVIYIIGLDEKTGSIYPTSGVDVAQWWSQISARFDQLAPELNRHINVAVGSGESVVALEFSTDRAPYVVTNPGGSSERDVPIRDGTRTRSATRDELLRMLTPEIATPPVVLLASRLSCTWQAARNQDNGRVAQSESTTLSGSAVVYVEHIGPAGVLFPVHEMSCELRAADTRLEGEIWLWNGGKDAPPPPAFGVHTRYEGLAATGPGRAELRFEWSSQGDHRYLGAFQDWELNLTLGVTGSSRPARVDGLLESIGTAHSHDNDNHQKVNEWSYKR